MRLTGREVRYPICSQSIGVGTSQWGIWGAEHIAPYSRGREKVCRMSLWVKVLAAKLGTLTAPRNQMVVGENWAPEVVLWLNLPACCCVHLSLSPRGYRHSQTCLVFYVDAVFILIQQGFYQEKHLPAPAFYPTLSGLVLPLKGICLDHHHLPSFTPKLYI